MNRSSIVYCDESQNDGPNYLNQEQPFYVLAGWIVPDHAIACAAIEIELLRQRYCNDAPELSFGTFKKRPWIVCQAMERLGTLGLVPVYVIAEKRYCVAGKIIETFLDPHYNPRVATPFTFDVPTKQELANTFYDRLSEDVLATFAEAYRNPTQVDLERALVRVADECRHCVNPEIAALLDGCKPELAAIAQDEVIAVTSWGKAMGTLNFPCLVSFLMIVEEIFRKQDSCANKIVHDEQGPYQEDYRRAFLLYRRAEDQRILLNGARLPYGAIRAIDDFEVQRSVDQPLLQAADLLAGSIASLATALLRGRHLHKPEVELGGLILPALLMTDLTIAMPVCSNRMLKRFGEAICRAYPDVSSRYTDQNEESPIRWTSTLSRGGPLPILPAPPVDPGSSLRPDVSVKITLPIYGLSRCMDDQFVVLLPPDKSYEETSAWERCVPLWTRREAADSFLHEQEWTEPHSVVEFGPSEVPGLVERLRATAQWTEFVCLNLFDDDCATIPIDQLANDMELLIERFVRAASSGIVPTIVQREIIGEHEVVSVLMSTGTYAAMKLPDGPMADGATRAQALANLTAALTC